MKINFQEGSCKMKNVTIGARIHSYRRVKHYNRIALKKALAYHGPATISINANPKSLKFYSKGVLDDITCSESWFIFFNWNSNISNITLRTFKFHHNMEKPLGWLSQGIAILTDWIGIYRPGFYRGRKTIEPWEKLLPIFNQTLPGTQGMRGECTETIPPLFIAASFRMPPKKQCNCL